MPTYCQQCILPDSRPGVSLDSDGVCQGCRYVNVKAEIDWSERAKEFQALVDDSKARTGSYDCVIPVSGGKDSYWQVVTCLEQGLRPLCVTYAYPFRTELGDRNLQGLVDIGVDHIDFKVNPRVERAFIDSAFRRLAVSGLVSHMAILTIPAQIALAYDIPLIVYGENPAFEYGTHDKSLAGALLDDRWIAEFGGTRGTTAADWVGETLSEQDLAPFVMPPRPLLEERGLRSIFLGHYFPWDPEASKRIAEQNGFAAREGGARVGHYDYVNIDDDIVGIHHHAKWHKFGITRSWDTLSMEIRAGRMSRAEAIDNLRGLGDETPWDDIRIFCEFLGIDQSNYFHILDGFRNPDVWSRRDGVWVIDDFLLPDFSWPKDFTASGGES
jgi:N-acetyl sugar amidotransferase